MATEKDVKNQEELNKLVETLNGVTQQTLELQRSISNALQDSVKSLEFERTEKAQIRSITKEISKIATENLSIIKDEVGTARNIANIQKQQNTLAQKRNTLESIQTQLRKDNAKENEPLLSGLQEQLDAIDKINESLDEQKTKNQEIRTGTAGAFTKLSEVIGDVPGLRQFKGPFEEGAKAARAAKMANAEALKSGGKQVNVLMAGVKGLGKALIKSFGPLQLLIELVAAFKLLDNGAQAIARGLGMSYKNSLQLQSSLSAVAISSNSIFVTTKAVGEAFLAVNKALGTNAVLSAELLEFQVKLVKQAGLTQESATQISILSQATGQSSEDITSEFLGQVKLLNIQNDTAINERAVLEDITNISKGTLATFAGQVKELASASFEARKLGLELKQLEGIADGLLDIESSLSAEFEAEVITGKQLNFERARFAALTNDLTTLGKELQAQDITREKFAKMNRLQQESIAKAIGISKDELGKSLIEQEAISKLSQFEGDSAKEKFNNAVKQLGIEGARKKLGNDVLADQMASAGVQERFNQSIEKLKEIFVRLVDPLMPVLDIFADIASIVGVIIRLLDPIIQTLMTTIRLATNAFDVLFGKKSISQGLSDTFKPLGDSLMNNNIYSIVGEAAGISPEDIVGDGIAPASRGPFTITDSFGATAITKRGDMMAVSPNITQEESINTTPAITPPLSPSISISPNITREESRNTPSTVVLSDAQIQKIANAVTDGASRATINLDGDKVSSRLQTPMVLNTLPGV